MITIATVTNLLFFPTQRPQAVRVLTHHIHTWWYTLLLPQALRAVHGEDKPQGVALDELSPGYDLERGGLQVQGLTMAP